MCPGFVPTATERVSDVKSGTPSARRVAVAVASRLVGPPTNDVQKSRPYKSFESTLDDVTTLLKLVNPHGLQRQVTAGARRVHLQVDKGPSADMKRQRMQS
jgi:hypothetical protein